MEIRILTGKAPEVRLTAAERRGLCTTLDVLKGVRDHLEEPLNFDQPEEFHGTAGLVLHDGFEDFVRLYAGDAEPTTPESKPEGPKKGEKK